MTQFTCHGPFKIPVSKMPVGKSISKTNIGEFWSSNPSYGKKVGCYVFGMRAGKGITPLYVGKATKSFLQEVFTHHKLNKYLHALSMYKSGTPVMYFVTYPPKSGVLNVNHINSLEKYLIQQAAIANPFLLNIKNMGVPKWGISGILRSTTKKPTNGAIAFKALLGL